jgi:hypothetical protein
VILHVSKLGGVSGLPHVWQPEGQLADGQRWQVGQQLREIELSIHIMAAAGTGQAGQDSSCSSSTGVPHEERVLPVMPRFP